MSQGGWAGTGWRLKANTSFRGLCRAWGTGDPEVAEVSFVPRVCDTGGSEFWQPRACWEPRPSCRQTPPRPHCAAQPASSCPFGVILLLALCRNPAPGPHTQELHCRRMLVVTQHPFSWAVRPRQLPGLQGPCGEAQCEGADRLGTEVAHSRPPLRHQRRSVLA